MLVAALIFVGGHFLRAQVLNTSLLSLLPAAEGDSLLAEANELLSRRASHVLAFVVGHPDPEKAAELGHRLSTQLLQSGFVENSLTDIAPEQQQAFYELYFPFRYQMLSARDRQALQRGKALPDFVARLTAALYSPASSYLKELIPRDPLLFFPELTRSWMETAGSQSAAQASEGIAFVDADGRSYAFTAVELSVDPFDSTIQDRLMSWITALRARLQTEDPQTRIYVSGVLPFAVAERLRTEREMTLVSLGSLLGVLALTGFIFGSPRTILLAAVPIAIGFVMAAAATILCFGTIHVITLAFGSSLIGVAFDYPVLYLAHHRMTGAQWNARLTLKRVAPGLLLGALTTLLGYAALSLAPFPGLRQMAVFSSVGLAAALITVLIWMPDFLSRGSSRTGEPRLVTWGQAFLAMLRRWSETRRGVLLACLFVVLAFIAGGLARLRADDDIRRLQRPSAALMQEQAFVQRGLRGFGDSRFILVRGNTVEELLQRQEALQDRLQSLVSAGTLTSTQSLAPFLPSMRRQREDHALLERAFSDPAPLRQALSGLGLPAAVANQFLEHLQRPMAFLTLDEWLKSPASKQLRALFIGATAHGVAAAALVNGSAESSAIIPALQGLPGVRYFDQVEEYTNLFYRYRRLSIGLIGMAYCIVWALMMSRYGLKTGTLVTAPSVGAIAFTFALFGWFGVPVNLLHCLAALLVLSMGIDYTIYFAEAGRAGLAAAPTLLAVTLCACTALLSFGLLALCRTPVLAAIGMTVFFGMALAFLFSPFPYLLAGREPGARRGSR
jgi:predicted exporter